MNKSIKKSGAIALIAATILGLIVVFELKSVSDAMDCAIKVITI